MSLWDGTWNRTGTDYAEGQEISLTADLYLYAKWEAPRPVTVTVTYTYNNGMEEGTDSAKVIPGANIIFPDAARKGYSFKGWYEEEALTVLAGNAGEEHPAPPRRKIPLITQYGKKRMPQSLLTQTAA